ncbi:TerD family protein [Streptomyces sp. NPDC000594]|uniref:TerD family protein n=1 Tax=Streptomyces sp. NPDC000594 TaxID=3154261 RepID=UPI003321341E
MTAELVRGQNLPLTDTLLEIRVSGGHPLLVCATCSGEHAPRTGPAVAHPGAPALPGVEVPRATGTDSRCTVDLAEVPAAVHRISLVLALPEGAGGPGRFGATAAPSIALAAPGSAVTATFTITGLDTETALVAVELYRRQGAWRIRAVGQGYADGLARLLADQGLDRAPERAAEIQRAAVPPAPTASARPATPGTTGALPGSTGPRPTREAPRNPAGTTPVSYAHPRRRPSPPPGPPVPPPTAPAMAPGPSAPPTAAPAATPGASAGPVAGDAGGWSMEERLYNQVWGMFEDLARTVAAYRSAVEFAESRLDQELDRILGDPRTRVSGAADLAREAARTRSEELIGQARQALDRDLVQLTAESDVVEPALPPALAGWDNPVWHAYRVPEENPMALRLGDLSLPEAPGLVIPFLVRLPLERGIWVDSGRTGSEAAMALDSDRLKRLALECAVAHAARMLAVHRPGSITLRVIDPVGSGTGALAPLLASGVRPVPPAVGAAAVAATLAQLTERVDLVTMALRGGAADALPPGLDLAEQLLIVHDFPHGFDDRSVARLRYLADEGPAAGVHLMMVADREEAAAHGPELDPLWRSLLRISPVPDDHLADPWVRHSWTCHPLTVPPGSEVLDRVLAQVAEAGRGGAGPG